MGTGTLALPFAAQQGGLLLNTVGLLVIAAWNLYSVQRLIHSLRLVKSDDTTTPPVVTSTFGRVAWIAFGEKGVHGLDVALVILFLGIIVAYEGSFYLIDSCEIKHPSYLTLPHLLQMEFLALCKIRLYIRGLPWLTR